MKHLFLFSILMAASPVLAQTAEQKGIVRKITHHRQDPCVAVSDVRIVAGGITSSRSDADGKLSITVPLNRDRSFILQDVRIPAASGYILASPARRMKIYLSPNELQIALITPEEKEQVSKANYKVLFRKYRQQNEHLLQQRNRLEDMQLEMEENDEKYKEAGKKIDSLQQLINQYFDEKNKLTVAATLKDMAEELAMTDYQSLDSIDARIFDLKKSGDWNTLSKMLNDVMNGNAAAYLQEGVENKNNAQVLLNAAQHDLSRRFQRMEEAIHAYQMQYQNDSVSRYYKILTQADPENWEYLNAAGKHEVFFMANYPQAQEYFKQALALPVEDSLKAISHTGLANVYSKMRKYKEALEEANQALNINGRLYGKKSCALAENHFQLATIYFNMRNDESALQQYREASKIGERTEERDLWIVRTYLGIMNLEIGRGNVIAPLMTLFSEPKISDAFMNFLDKDYEDIKILPLVNQFEDLLVHALGFLSADQPEMNITGREILQELLEGKMECFGTDHPDVARTYLNLGNLYLDGHLYEKAFENYTQGLNILVKLFGERHAAVADAYLTIGKACFKTKQIPKALEHYNQSIKILKAIYGEQNPHLATAYIHLGNAFLENGKNSEAEQKFSKALAILKAHYGEENHPEIARVYQEIGIACLKSNKETEASEKFTQSLKVLKALYGEQHKKVADAYSAIALAYFNQQSPQAIAYFKQALDIQKKLYGKHHIEIAETYLHLGHCYLMDNHPEAAIESFDQTLKIQKALFGPVHQNLATTLMSIAGSYLQVKNYPEAIKYFTKAQDIQKAIWGEDHLLTANYYVIIGDIYADTEQYEKAIRCYEKYQKFAKDHMGLNNAETTKISNTIGNTYFNAGDYPKAIESYTETLNLLANQQEKDIQNLSNTLMSRGDAYAMNGDLSKALENYAQSVQYLKEQSGKNDVLLSIVYGKMGNIHNMEKQYKNALKFYALSKELLKKTTRSDSPELAILHINMGLAHYKMGEKEAALDDFTQCLKIQEALHLDDDITLKARHYIQTVKKEMGTE